MKVNHSITAQLKSISLTLLASVFLAISPMSVAQDDTSTQAWQQIQGGAIVIDVRTKEEFSTGHLEGAHNIPFEEIVAGVSKLELAKDTKIVLYCRSGRRSGIANDALVVAGYSQTVNGGGYQELVDAKEQAQAK